MRADLLPRNASPLEASLDLVSAERWSALDPSRIGRAKDAILAPDALVPFLAYEASVDVWSSGWPHWKKRAVVEASARDKPLKGTLAGLERYLELADAALVQIVRPPQGVFAAPDLSAAEWAALVEAHPRIRITFHRGEGAVDHALFAGDGFVGDAAVGLDDGRALHGRRAWLERGGVAEPLQTLDLETSAGPAEGVVLERLVVAGEAAPVLGSDAGFVDADFADASDRAPQFFTFSVSRGFVVSDTRLSLSTLAAGLEPRDVTPRRESELRDRDPGVFVGDPAGRHFALPDLADEMLADVLYLHDPAIGVPQVTGMSFADHSRVSMEPRRAEILADAHRFEPVGASWWAGLGFAGSGVAGLEDPAPREFLRSAIDASARLADRVLFTTQTLRPRTFADGIRLDGSASLSDEVPNHL